MLRLPSLQRSYKKTTIKWSFSYNAFVKLSVNNTAHLYDGPFICQGLHRLEKSLNIQDCLEKSLKIKLALKST